MSTFARVALIGFGEVGQTLARDLSTAGVELSAYDILFDETDSIPSRGLRSVSVRAAATAAEAVENAELIISAVTAAADVAAARSVVPGLMREAFFLDVNSSSPGMKQESAVIIEGAGGRYVEAAVMTPIQPKGIASYMLLGGRHAAAFIEHARPLGFTGEVFSDSVGQAAATKLCRSVVIKGVEALLTESLLAARHYGVEKTVLDSLSDLLPVGDWEKLARYMISRALAHGTRRAEEMREAARTVREAGIDPLMASATAERQDRSAAYKAALSDDTDLAAMLDRIRQELDSRKEPQRKAARG